MSEISQQNMNSSGGGPRFRIVPGPMLGENNARPTTSRSMTMTTSISAPTFQTQQQIKQEDIVSSSPQHVVVGTVGTPQARQSVQYVVINQGSGGNIASMGDINGNSGARVATPQPQGTPQHMQQLQQTSQQQQSPAHLNAAEQANMVTKCARFFKTLIHLSQQPDQQQGQQTAVRVTELVKLVIYGSMPPEIFTSRLQEALRSQAQPHLLPFLQKTLPALRAALQKGELVIEGISAPSPQQTENVQPTQWESSQMRPPLENSFQQSQAQPIAVQQVLVTTAPSCVSTAAKTNESADESTMETSDSIVSENEVRQLPANHLFFRILNGDVISRKIQRAMPDGGLIHEEVITMISQAAEYRLRAILAHLAVVAEHRLEPLRNNPFYQALDDTRRQLRFVEELDRQEHERRENREKEALIRLSKSKGKDKDTLVEKAKQIQRADQEAARNRDANAAAIAALGGSKATKRSWADAVNPFEQPISSGLSTQTHRPRTKRVTMRDLQLVISMDPIARCSPLRHRLSLFNSPTDTVAS